MLRIAPCLLSLAIFVCSVVGAPRYNPYHGPHTRGGNSNGSPTTTTTRIPTPTNPGGEFYVQTTMPSKTAQPTMTYVGEEYEEDTNGATTTSTTTGSTAGPSNVSPGTGSLQCYRLASDFPPSSQWVSLQTLIATSRPDMIGSSNDGPDEADAAIAAVQSVSESAGFDPYDPPNVHFLPRWLTRRIPRRIGFVMMMQESSGKVRPIVGDNGKSYGLFQAQIPGIPLCNNYAKNECPEEVITTQIEFGIFGHAGTGSPVAPGIAYWMEAQAGNVGRALRGYNTGSVPDPNDLTQSGGATASYVSDVANRLTGALVGAKHQATCS